MPPKQTPQQWRFAWVQEHPEQCAAAFDDFPEFSQKFLAESIPGPGVIVKNGAIFSADYRNKYTHCSKGIRHTPGNPEDYAATIHLLGPSFVIGVYCRDSDTIASHLQRICNETMPEKKYRVLNYGTRYGSLDFYTLQINALPIQEHDVVIVLSHIVKTTTPKAKLWQCIKNQQLMSRKKGAKYCFFLYPRWNTMLKPSDYEKMRFCNSFQDLYEKKPVKMDYVPPEKYLPPPIVQQLAAAECPCIDLQPFVERPHDRGELLVDASHLAGKGNKFIAELIHKHYIAHLNVPIMSRTRTLSYGYAALADMVQKMSAKNTAIRAWGERAKNTDFDKAASIGAIVMNCNPFTLGHRFLIEEALRQVEALYILVVEEDRSDFTFADRIALVRKGVADLGKRVHVVPGGKFVISAYTFPEYFVKSQEPQQTKKIDPSNDVALFGAVIAPMLSVTHRFIGEEPYCNVTRQYNKTMKKMLPPMGIEVHEIPRKQQEGEAISASRVRVCLQNGTCEELKTLVPETTYTFLQGMLKNAK